MDALASPPAGEHVDPATGSGPLAADAIKPEPPRRGWWLTRRFALAAIGVVLLSGGATAVLALNEVGKIVDALGRSRAVKIGPNVLTAATTGAPQTLLLVGNDERKAPKGNPNGFVLPHSNEMLLVRIDPSKPTISMMSIPRELQVPIHTPSGQVVVTRINAALAFGGIELMTKTIKREIGIPINHVFVISFNKFKQAVNEMGCVYMTIDRRYFHRNEPGGEQYFEINLQPGYQRVCGEQALEFVANRHEDTSLTRDARDQRFLLEVKSQFGPSLFEDRERFEHILGGAVETDLHGTGQVLDLLRLLIAAAGKPVRQVPFQVTLLPTFDTATPQQIQESVSSFLSGTAAIHNHHVAAAPSHHSAHAPSPSSSGLTPTSAEAIDAARSQAPRLPFPLEYPRARQSFAGSGPDQLRVYAIRDPAGRVHPAYVVAMSQGQLGQFYDVIGTSWSDPPLLSSPEQEVHIGSRTYGLFYAGEKLREVAWHEQGASYWVENTLTDALSPRVMLAIAEQTAPVVSLPGTPPPSAPASGPLPAFKIPPRAVATASTLEEVGAGLGLAGVVVVALVGAFVLVRQRQVAELREQVAGAMNAEARQRPLLAAAGLAPSPEPALAGAPGFAGASGLAGARASTLAEAPAPPQRAARDDVPRDGDGRAIYHARRRWRRGALVGAAAVVVVLAAGAYLLTRPAGHSAPASASPYALPVVVFNATHVADAAHRTAATLASGHARVAHVGNINPTLGPGTFVLYPPGAHAEATRIAALLPGAPAAVTAIQPAVQSAIGHADEIVVVLD